MSELWDMMTWEKLNHLDFDLSDYEYIKREDPVKIYAIPYKGVVETFPIWKKMVLKLFGNGHFAAYRFWHEADPEIKALAKEVGDVAYLEKLVDNFEPLEEDKTSDFMFKPNDKYYSTYCYLTRHDCKDWIVWLVRNGKVLQTLNLSKTEFKRMFTKKR